MEWLRLPVIWRHVFAATHSPKTSFSRTERRETLSRSCVYWSVNVSPGFGERQTTRRDENSVENTDCATPSNLSLALDAPLHTDSRRAKPPPPPPVPDFLHCLYIISIDTADESMLPFANIIFVPVFCCFSSCFSSFFFLEQIYIPASKRNFYFITCYIGFFVNRIEPSRIHPIRILYTRYQFRSALLFNLVI